jgi:glycosyltransferase involved in cell wall biosynthesis
MASQVLVALADAWGSRHGGVNAFNYDLCGGLASRLRGTVPIVCVVPRASEDDRHAASKASVILLSTESDALDSGDVRVVLERADYREVVWWIGHDLITGPLALKVRSQLGGQVALIHHMNYAAYTSYKHGEGALAMERHDAQRVLFSQADRAFAVGPLLRDSLSDMLDDESPRPGMLIPGLPKIRARTPAGPFKAIIVGRLGPEDDRIKQGRLAVAGVAMARRRAKQTPGSPPLLAQQRPSIHLIGLEAAGGETEISFHQLSETWGGDAWPQVVAQPFIEDREALFGQIASAHVALMPSWHEGFGLTGWEAVAAGVPLIVSEESGLYRLIKELAPGLENCLVPVTVGGHLGLEDEENFTEQDVEKIAVAVAVVAGDWQAAKARAGTLKQLLDSKSINWDATAGELLTGLGVNQSPPPSGAHRRPDSSTQASVVLVDRRTPLGKSRDGPESLLLRPESQVVPFHITLESLCTDILTWTLDDVAFPQRIALRLYAAEGGSGKTRLLIEACSRLLDRAENDWVAGFLADRRQNQALVQEIPALVNSNARVFIVIDYAETRRLDVRTVVSSALRAPANHRIRIVLLGRGEGDGWDLLRQEERRDQDLRHFLASLQGTQGPFPLPQPRADDLDARREIFEGARQAFSSHLGKRAETSPPPNLGAAPFGQMLFLHLGALASLHGRALEEEGALLDATLDRERDYWIRALGRVVN